MKIIYKLFVAILLIIALPVIVVIGVGVFLWSGFPIFFCQKLVGKDGKVFTMYKFRTMVANAEKLKTKYQNFNEADGPAFKIHNDPRFTPIGKFLSHTGLDELPQLWNVLRGDMALIGPRPLPVSEEKKLKSWQKERERVLPGIISPWILNGHHANTFDAWMKSDITYVKSKSFMTDVHLFLRSIPFMVGLVGKAVM